MRQVIALAVGMTAAAAAAGCGGDGAGGAPSVPLFDGVGFAGWTGVSADPAVRWQDVWSVVGGRVRCAGEPWGYIRTERTYRNFVLRLRIRHLAPGNGGVFLRVQAPDKVWPRAIEAQGLSGALGDIWNLDGYPMVTDPARTEGARTARIHADGPENDVGLWNDYRIALQGDRLELEVNGVVQNRATEVAELDGFIALQSEGARYEIGDVVLTPLP
jgi:hypothetical protein